MQFTKIHIILVSNEMLQNREKWMVSNTVMNEVLSLGYIVERITILPENLNLISNEIQVLSKCCDVIFVIEKLETNICLKALAKAFFDDLKWNPNISTTPSKRSSKWNIGDLLIPASAKLLTKDNTFPIVYTHRVYLLKDKVLNEQFIALLKSHLTYYRGEKYAVKILEMGKSGIASVVTLLRNSNVTFDLKENENTVVIKISMLSLSPLNNCVTEILKLKQNDIVRSYVPPLPFVDISNDVCLIKQAIQDLEKCFKSFGPENVFIAFNGGKDCTVLLHLMNHVLISNYPDNRSPIFCLYVQSEYPFPEQDEFLQECQQYYGLKVKIIRSGIKAALAEVLKEHPNLKACLMGTRKTDPYSQDLKAFQMTDSDWPQVMRVNPLLNWHHSDIWDFLLFYNVFYCKLYDMGYTSLGSVTNTEKNSSLKYFDVLEEEEKYLPAYKLLNDKDERNGRIS